MNLAFYEDHHYSDLGPLSVSHPSYKLLCGTSPIYRKWLSRIDYGNYSFFSRSYLRGILNLDTGKPVNESPNGETIFINGRFLPTPAAVNSIMELKPNEALAHDGSIAAFKIGPDLPGGLNDILKSLHNKSSEDELLSSFKIRPFECPNFRYLWEMVNFNGDLIRSEFDDYEKTDTFDKPNSGISLINPENIFIHKSVSMAPSVVIDASDGPVIIEEGTSIEPFSYIQGPCYIGPDCRVVGGKVREGTSLGPVCRVGGEIEESIMLGYCNKYHEGFLGHAYLGEWVNLGALTTNSDLKNNYGEISIELGSETVKSGSIKVGCFIGDHTKTGIGTMLNTGINIGFSCNLYGAALFTEKIIKPFSWGTPGNLSEYRLEKAIETASLSMARRNVEFTSDHRELFSYISENRY